MAAPYLVRRRRVRRLVGLVWRPRSFLHHCYGGACDVPKKRFCLRAGVVAVEPVLMGYSCLVLPSLEFDSPDISMETRDVTAMKKELEIETIEAKDVKKVGSTTKAGNVEVIRYPMISEGGRL